jgi:hypothetical protein
MASMLVIQAGRHPDELEEILEWFNKLTIKTGAIKPETQ